MHDFSNIDCLLKSILEGVDPITGEIFDRRDMYNNSSLKRTLKPLFMISSGKLKPESKNLLNRNSTAIFDELKKWRLEKARALGFPAYYIFTDEELWSIAEGDVCNIEDLLMVKGISNVKLKKYGNELFQIIKKYM